MTSVDEVHDPVREHLLDAAEQVFYSRGVQAVGMDRLRTAANLPLRRIYQLFPSKDDLVVAFLRRRHDRMMASIAEFTDKAEDGAARVSAIFTWLHKWFCEPDFRGCPWMNVFGELGATNPAVAAEVHHHQREFRKLLSGIVVAAGYSRETGNVVHLLAEGAVSTAAVQRTATPATEARRASEVLIAAEEPAKPRRRSTRAAS
ncbi:TetR/AcrR family transcriptional regulator [Amycolatopsis rhabdoformis]|uniref:TetR/AcrR family transcriptional regulator n=1 Tax=Amycolatopsis rhabdoformis TaxID=1448059 RepID=A0ABZ1IIB3_9PSEU|nr:TetR/AcrR family transcriptional regulator [Amycolatopsis rhabdoformis]WSE33692.1 TetR/AcrR family transcriptional regulator [Amycolatopsis rhabdoformis]